MSTTINHADAKAILRQKTLLGETYVELTPGTPGSRAIPEGGTLEVTQVSRTVARALALNEDAGSSTPEAKAKAAAPKKTASAGRKKTTAKSSKEA